jgi:uncharacterized RmlC-like cupin family protein
MTNEGKKPTKQIARKTARSGKETKGKRALLHRPGSFKQATGAQKALLQIMILPPGARGKAHKPEDYETAIYVLSGKVGVWYGEQLKQQFTAEIGDFVYIPADMLYLTYNPSENENCVTVIARTNPGEKKTAVLPRERDHLRAARGKN